MIQSVILGQHNESLRTDSFLGGEDAKQDS